MKHQKVVVMVAVVLVFCARAYAGELASGEAQSYFREAVEAQKKEKFTEAIMGYQKTMLVAPKGSAYEKYIANNLGMMYASQGDIDRAEILFKEALKQDTSYKPAQYNLGLILDKRPDKLKAIEYWLAVLKVDLNSMKPKEFSIENAAASTSTKE